VEFDEDALRAIRVRAKRQVRQRMRSLRAAIPPAALAARSAKIVEHVVGLAAFGRARALALFWPVERLREVDLRLADARARELGKRVYYPCLIADGERLTPGFREVIDTATLSEQGRGFAEPPDDAPVAEPGRIDLVVVPALAVSVSRHRLGYGSGFYDAVLPLFCPPAFSVVVAYSFQLLGELPVDEHDVVCDSVVTDVGVI
jgi:5-formyltetrahydrofolate cyclo-ligase